LKKNIFVFFENFIDIETALNMNKYFNGLGAEVNNIDLFLFNSDFRKNFLMENINYILNNLENLLIIGVNLRLELPLLNSRLRKAINNNREIKVFSLGLSNIYGNIKSLNLSSSIYGIKKILNGRGLFFDFLSDKNDIFKNIFLKNKQNLTVFIGIKYYNTLSFYFKNLEKSFNLKIYCIYNNISYCNFLETSRLYSKSIINNIENSFVFLQNVDNSEFYKKLENKNNFLVYVGHHLSIGGNKANMIFPISSMYEYSGYFLNIFGKICKQNKSVYKDLLKPSNLFIVLKLYNRYFFKSNFSKILNFRKILSYFDFFNLDFSINSYYLNLNYLSLNLIAETFRNENFSVLKDQLFSSEIFNYYKLDVYSFNSKSIHLASLDYLVKLKSFI
jgi:hypothetical protein